MHHMGDMTKRSFLLDLTPIFGSATHELLAQVVELRSEVHFNSKEPNCPIRTSIVSDGGSNVQGVRNSLAPEDSEGCLNHDIKLCIDDVMTESVQNRAFFSLQLKNDLDALSATILIVIGSSHNWELFQNGLDAKVMHLELILRNATRWEGVYRCVDRSLGLRSGFEFLFPNESVARRDLIDSLDKSTPEDFLADTYWNRLTSYESILKVSIGVSIKAQADSVSTISQVVQWIGQLEDICASRNSDSIAVAAVRAKFARSLKSRVLPRIQIVNNTTMASVCDPRNAMF